MSINCSVLSFIACNDNNESVNYTITAYWHIASWHHLHVKGTGSERKPCRVMCVFVVASVECCLDFLPHLLTSMFSMQWY